MKRIFTLLTFLVVSSTFFNMLYAQRDPYKWPFAQNSIWNLPIHNNAEYIDAKIGIPSNGFGVDEDYLVLTPNAPSTPVYTNYAGWDRTKSRCPQEGPLLFNAPIPVNFVISPGIWSGNTPNAGLAVLMPDGVTIKQTQPFARCESGNYGTSRYVWSDVNIYGDGIIGAHGGSGMSAIGGTIRLGELVPGGEIRHVMKMNIYAAKYLFYNGTTGGKRWPAPKADGYASGVYGTLGTPEFECRMGALLALKPDLDLSSLNFETGMNGPAMILARAYQNYGAYIVDDTAWDVVDICTEFSPEGRVTDEFRTAWGYNLKSSTNTPFGRDLIKIISRLHVVTNNTANTIGGGQTTDLINRRAPAACEFGEPGSGLKCSGEIPNVPVTGIALQTDTILLAVGTSRTINANLIPSWASNKKVTWSTENDEIALVNEGGVVSGISRGKTIITVTTEDGNFSASAVIIVISQYIEDFMDNNAQDWTTSGNFLISIGKLSTTHWAPSCTGTYNGLSFYAPYTYKLSMLGSGTAPANITRILFNYQDNSNYYFVEFTGGSNGVASLKKMSEGVPTTIASYGLFVTSSSLVNVELTYVNNSISVLAVKGGVQTVLFDHVSDVAFSYGRIGVGTAYNNVHFSNITVNYEESGTVRMDTHLVTDMINIYPNPSTRLEFTVELPHLSGKKHLEIYSIIGELIYARELDEGNIHQISAGNKARKGLFLVKIITEQKVFTMKLVIE